MQQAGVSAPARFSSCSFQLLLVSAPAHFSMIVHCSFLIMFEDCFEDELCLHMKLTELKEELEARGEPKSGSKAWLTGRHRLHAALVRAHFEARDDHQEYEVATKLLCKLRLMLLCLMMTAAVMTRAVAVWAVMLTSADSEHESSAEEDSEDEPICCRFERVAQSATHQP